MYLFIHVYTHMYTFICIFYCLLDRPSMAARGFAKNQLIFKILCISELYLHYFPIRLFPFYIFTLFQDYHEVNYYTVFWPLLAVTIHLAKNCDIHIMCCEFSVLYRIKECIKKGELKNYLVQLIQI